MDGFARTLRGETLASFGDDELLKVLHRVPILGRLKLTQIFFFSPLSYLVVFTKPGSIITRSMPNNISSNRSTSDIPSSPHLEALYAPRSGIGTFAPLEVMFTMRPAGPRRFLSVPKRGAKAWITTSGAIMLTSSCRLYSLGLR